MSADWVQATAQRVLRELEAHRATWQSWHVYAEAQRQVRDVAVPPERVGEVVQWVVDATEQLFVNLTPDRDPIAEPDALRRSDGTASTGTPAATTSPAPASWTPRSAWSPRPG